MSSKSGLIHKWLNPALQMISNILEPQDGTECHDNNPSIQSSVMNIPKSGRMLSDSDDSDLGLFFKDVVECHKSRENFDKSDQNESIYNSDEEYESECHLDLMALGDINANKNDNEVYFLKKLKPEGTYFMEDRPCLLNMRSHVFVMEEKENEIGDNVFSFINKDNHHDNRKFYTGLTRTQSARYADTKDVNCKDKDSNITKMTNSQIYDVITTRTRTKPVSGLKANKSFLRRSFNDAMISVNHTGIKDPSSSSLTFSCDENKGHGERRVRSAIDNRSNARSNKKRKCTCGDICICPTVPVLFMRETSRIDRIEDDNQHDTERKTIQQSEDNIPIESLILINPKVSEVEMENMICASIVENMTKHKDDVPISFEILFQCIRNICTARFISGLDPRDIGYNIYYSCCSTLLLHQLVVPALLQPMKWNLAYPSSAYKDNQSTSFSASSQSIDCNESESSSINERNQSNPVSRTNSPKKASPKACTPEHSIPILLGNKNSFSGVSPLHRGLGLSDTSGASFKSSMYSPISERSQSRSDTVYESIQQSDINTNPMSLRFSKLLVGSNNADLRKFPGTVNSSNNVTAASSRNNSYDYRSPKNVNYSSSSSSSSTTSFYKYSGDSIQLSDDKDCRRDSMDTGVSTGSGQGIFNGSGSPKPLRSSLSFKIFRTDSNIHTEDGNDSSKSGNGRGGGGERCKESNKGCRVEEEKESKSWSNSSRKIILSETLMHAAISLICIAHILGGEGKSLEDLLCIWGADKDQGNEIFAAARTLINCVPLKKVHHRFYLYD